MARPVTTWRLKAVSGAGWVERVHPDGSATITAYPRQAQQFPTEDAARAAAAAIVGRGHVPVRHVSGWAFERTVHGHPG